MPGTNPSFAERRRPMKFPRASSSSSLALFILYLQSPSKSHDCVGFHLRPFHTCVSAGFPSGRADKKDSRIFCSQGRRKLPRLAAFQHARESRRALEIFILASGSTCSCPGSRRRCPWSRNLLLNNSTTAGPACPLETIPLASTCGSCAVSILLSVIHKSALR